MPALSTQIVTAVATQLGTLFPGVKVTVRRGDEKFPAYMPGDTVPGLVVTCNDQQERKNGTALKVFCDYVVVVHYLTKEVPNSTKGELDVARAAQQTIRQFFDFAGWAAVSGVNRCEPTVGKAYNTPYADKTVCDSAVTLAFETFELRN